MQINSMLLFLGCQCNLQHQETPATYTIYLSFVDSVIRHYL